MLTFLAALAAAPLAPTDSDPTPVAAAADLLVSPAWLASRLKDPGVVVLHVARTKAEYDKGHIPGARFLPAQSLWTTAAPGVELPPVAHLDSVFESVGVSNRSRVILYGEAWSTPRAFLSLDYLGVGDQAALLDGGLAGWQAAGNALSTDAPAIARGKLDPKPRTDLVVDATWVAAHLNDGRVAFIDGRSPEEYAGTTDVERMPRYGHLPNARNLPWTATYSNGPAALDGIQSAFVDRNRLAALFTEAGAGGGRQIVTYCTVGLRASHLYFVARLLGHRPRIYDGSMRDWTPRAELPLVESPNPPKAPAKPAGPQLGIFVQPDWLHEHWGEPSLVVIHADRNRAAYDSAHIEGAKFVALSQYVTERDGLPTELPTPATLDSLLESLGVSDDSRLVLYGETLPVARLFFTLDYLGLGDRVVVLDGGLAAWRAGGHPVTTEATAARTGRLTVAPRSDLVVDANWVRQAVSQTDHVVLDARSAGEYTGTAPAEGLPRVGHVPGARHLDWTTLFSEGRLKNREALLGLFAAAGATPGKTVATYCRVGTRASALYLVARALGFPTRMYDGSMADWSKRADLPIVTGAEPGQP